MYIRREHICAQCGKDFKTPFVGNYPYRIKNKSGVQYFCSEHCKRIYEEDNNIRHWMTK